jgi:acetyl-CoA acetyltransferase
VAALGDADVPRGEVEALLYGNFMGEVTEAQGHQGPLMAEAAGLRAPATRYESACASAGVAVREAVKQLRSGEADVLLVGGAERMHNVGTAGAIEGLAMAADDLYEVRAGVTFPGAYALMARAYFDRYGGTREDCADVARAPATADAATEAYGEAGIAPDDVDFAEVHDCFTIAEVLAVEELGFYGPGEGVGAARGGETTRDGDLPVNLSGGLKARGHPVGATGASQVVEATRLLRGDHPNSDVVPDDRVGVTHSAGGAVASAVVHVLEVAG